MKWLLLFLPFGLLAQTPPIPDAINNYALTSVHGTLTWSRATMTVWEADTANVRGSVVLGNYQVGTRDALIEVSGLLNIQRVATSSIQWYIYYTNEYGQRMANAFTAMTVSDSYFFTFKKHVKAGSMVTIGCNTTDTVTYYDAQADIKLVKVY